ncbi:porin [Flavobacteriaceae bacterium]|nr:porin [Flavobacteriaceae bacterium]
MKIMKIISLFLFLISFNINSQSSLNSYSFGEGISFTADNGSMIKLSGYAQPHLEIKNYNDLEENSSSNRFRLRRLRLRFDGQASNPKFAYRFQVDLSGSSETGEATGDFLLDAYVSYDITNRIQVIFGQRSAYTDNRELFMNSNSLQLVERSRLTSAFSSIREFGLFLSGNFRLNGQGSYLRPYFVLTNGDGINNFDKDLGGLKIGGRIDFLPFGLFTNKGQFRQIDVMRELTPKFVIGVNYSHNSGMSSRRGRNSGSILYLNELGQQSLPDYTKYGIDFLFKYNGFSALGEYVKSSSTVPTDIIERVRNDGSTSSSFLVNGVQDIESYVNGRMMLGEAYNIQMGYLFKSGITIDSRYTHLKADDNSFLNNATFYNRPNYYTLGIGKLLGRNYGAKIQGSITLVDGSLGVNHDNDTATDVVFKDELLFRLITTISF